ncbi:MAG: type VI secretion system baseplate subunit TssE [Gammaproteobacteria bacterium]|nr:type VI secretion system baseplate subunit TssE [Gammaproteobacteria bacterium]
MPELTQKERLQPSLLDRLTDDDPTQQLESRTSRVLSMKKLREAVRRDLSYLLNTCNFESTEDLEGYDHVASSVMNFGVRELSGTHVIGISSSEIEEMVRTAIIRFEPRILPDTLTVEVRKSDEMNNRALSFDIEGKLWAQPQPTRLFLRTELDLESGDIIINDLGV